MMKRIVMHGKYHNDLKTGYLKYEIEAITPLHILTMMKICSNPMGQYAIPGNTIRGMTRYNASIFSFSSVINTELGKEDIKIKDIIIELCFK